MMAEDNRSPIGRSPSPNYRERRDRSASPQRAAQNPGTNLFVTGLMPKVKEEELEQLFSKYGNVLDDSSRSKKFKL
jgi:RNA recognition motif-containing protein